MTITRSRSNNDERLTSKVDALIYYCSEGKSLVSAQSAMDCALSSFLSASLVGTISGIQVYRPALPIIGCSLGSVVEEHVISEKYNLFTDSNTRSFTDRIVTIDGAAEAASAWYTSSMQAYRQALRLRSIAINDYHHARNRAYSAFIAEVKSNHELLHAFIDSFLDQFRELRCGPAGCKKKLTVVYRIAHNRLFWYSKKKVLDTKTGRYRPSFSGNIKLPELARKAFNYPPLLLLPKPPRPIRVPLRYLTERGVLNPCDHEKSLNSITVWAPGYTQATPYRHDGYVAPYHLARATILQVFPTCMHGCSSSYRHASWTSDPDQLQTAINCLNSSVREGLPDPQSLLLQLWEMLENVALIKLIYIERRLIKANTLPKRIAEAFLLIEFCIRPLISTINSLLSHTQSIVDWCVAYTNNISLPEKQRIIRRHSATASLRPVHLDTYISSVQANTTGYDCVTVYGYKKPLTAAFIDHANTALQAVSAINFASDAINILDPESIISYADEIWNAIPFSFIVDMITNLSDSLVVEWNSVPLEPQLTVVTSKKQVTHFNVKPAAGYSVEGSFVKENYVRTISYASYQPIIQPYVKDLSAEKAAIFAALAVVLA